MNYQKINNIAGWSVFVLASAVYILTAEPTASFWDCGEFIAASYKLQVPHPPGAPFFLLIGRMFSFLAGGDVERVAFWINVSSAVASGATIMLLFWSINLLAKKFIIKAGETPSTYQTLSIMGAGLVGAAVYTFSDSFWFSAVEAEVYAMSSFFTALVIWIMLKWESLADTQYADRWLLLLAYATGLSIGVHLLNLVTVPALAYIYYFKKYKPTTKGIVIAGLLGFVILGIINSGIIPGLPTIAGKFEIFFVNSLGLPFGAGIVFFAALFLGALVYGIRWSLSKGKAGLHLSLLSLAFILIGYASYGIILVRSNANPPIDENNPENIISFVSYLKREQYGDRPLIYGPSFTAELVKQDRSTPLYRKGESKYEIYDYKIENQFDPKHNILFPRIYSRQPGHPELYCKWMGVSTSVLQNKNWKPNMAQNISYMFGYQFGHMYFRYFMWNFAGRAGDAQDSGWLLPWEKDEKAPESLTNSKARNQFYMLPFILGILGLAFHYGKDKQGFAVVAMVFVLTGLAVNFYLNSPPVEPRERDYIYVGSYYAFAIWIGFGVLAIADMLQKIIKNNTLRAGIATGLCLIVPGIMAAEGWDDHDRSKRYHSVDSAKNLLNSCAKNAILFTGGDNDTFPLWYVQEVEGFRTDVRVCNLSLLNTDWYVSQMKDRAYESEPLPITLEYENFIQGTNDYIPFYENAKVKNGINLKQYIKLVKENHPAVRLPLQSGGTMTTLPTKTFILPVDTAKVLSLGIIPDSMKAFMLSTMQWTISNGSLDKKDLVMLDMIANGEWERPIYFSSTLAGSNYLNLKDHMQLEGLAYRLLPVKVPGASQGWVNSDIMYDRMMNGTFVRALDDSGIFYDENYLRFTLNLRSSFVRLADQLVREEKTDKAKEVLTRCLTTMPNAAIPYDVYMPQFIPVLFKVGMDAEALDIANVLGKRLTEELDYYATKDRRAYRQEVETNLYVLNGVISGLREAGKTEEVAKWEESFNKHYSSLRYSQGGGGL